MTDVEMVELRVALPAPTLAALAEVVAGLGMHPAQWLAAQARAATLAHTEKDQLVRLWLQGHPDSEIARRMNQTNQWVARRRAQKKLPANRKFPRITEASMNLSAAEPRRNR